MRNEGVTMILRFIKVRVSGESTPATGCCWGKRGGRKWRDGPSEQTSPGISTTFGDLG